MDWFLLEFSPEDADVMKHHVVSRELRDQLVKDLISRGSNPPSRMVHMKDWVPPLSFYVDYDVRGKHERYSSVEIDGLIVMVSTNVVPFFIPAIRRQGNNVRRFANNTRYHKLHFKADCLVLSPGQLSTLRSAMTTLYGDYLSRHEVRL